MRIVQRPIDPNDRVEPQVEAAAGSGPLGILLRRQNRLHAQLQVLHFVRFALRVRPHNGLDLRRADVGGHVDPQQLTSARRQFDGFERDGFQTDLTDDVQHRQQGLQAAGFPGPHRLPPQGQLIRKKAAVLLVPRQRMLFDFALVRRPQLQLVALAAAFADHRPRARLHFAAKREQFTVAGFQAGQPRANHRVGAEPPQFQLVVVVKA